MKCHRVTFVVVDFDSVGADGVVSLIENTRFPNDAISPYVTNVETRDIGEWSDEHPLNNSSTCQDYANELFAKKAAS